MMPAIPNLDLSTVEPGDVLTIPGAGWVGVLIRWQYRLTGGTSAFSNYGHVVIAKGRDEQKRYWGIQASPSGVGWVDLAKYDGKPILVNSEQPKTPAARTSVIEAMPQLIGSHYDYGAYVIFALEAIGVTPEWTDLESGKDVPPHFVCSALAAYLYRRNNLACPLGPIRLVRPGDWAKWTSLKGWLKSPIGRNK
jgi:hypothetical protein